MLPWYMEGRTILKMLLRMWPIVLAAVVADFSSTISRRSFIHGLCGAPYPQATNSRLSYLRSTAKCQRGRPKESAAQSGRRPPRPIGLSGVSAAG